MPNELKCPKCGARVTKAGFIKWFKGGHLQRKQQYKCWTCGLNTVKPAGVVDDK